MLPLGRRQEAERGPELPASLDYANRLLLQFARVEQGGDGQGETVCLALEVIENHAYERSRFLRGAVVDESKIELEALADPAASGLKAEATPLRWLGPERLRFELLDKPIVFDDAQEQAYQQEAQRWSRCRDRTQLRVSDRELSA